MVSFDFNNTFYIRVYYQDLNDQICELCRDGANPWTQGAKLPVAAKGTSIASTSLKAMPNHIWLWFQLPNTSIVGYLYRNQVNWTQGKLYWGWGSPSSLALSDRRNLSQQESSSPNCVTILVLIYRPPLTEITATASSLSPRTTNLRSLRSMAQPTHGSLAK